jgi:site-specific DNA-cytosine methylase
MRRWRTVKAIDFDAKACAVYRANFPSRNALRKAVGT